MQREKVVQGELNIKPVQFNPDHDTAPAATHQLRNSTLGHMMRSGMFYGAEPLLACGAMESLEPKHVFNLSTLAAAPCLHTQTVTPSRRLW